MLVSRRKAIQLTTVAGLAAALPAAAAEKSPRDVLHGLLNREAELHAKRFDDRGYYKHAFTAAGNDEATTLMREHVAVQKEIRTYAAANGLNVDAERKAWSQARAVKAVAPAQKRA